MSGRNLTTFLQYGVSSVLAEKAARAGLTVSKVRNISQKDLITKYDLSQDEAKILSKAVRRDAIDADIVQLLLENSNFVCCVCKGVKGKTYIIHHIVEHSKTQDNSYSNLAVLCPNDHDSAHQGGLTLRLKPSQIESAKNSWEKVVEVENARRAAQKIEVQENAIDYVNINRIEELCIQLYKKIPQTQMTSRLQAANILNREGSFDQKFVENKLSRGRYLFDYISHGETEHYRQLMERIAENVDFIDLDAALSGGRKKLQEVEGQHAFFIGGVHASAPRFPITKSTPPVVMYYTRKKIRIEWILDPAFLMSTSAIGRIGGKNRYIIYCLVRTVDRQEDKSILIKASPFLIAQPTKYINKTPIISYIKNHERYSQFFDEDE